MTDLVKFPAAVRAVWSSACPTVATSGAVFLVGAQWGDWDGALAVAVLKAAQLRIFTLDAAGDGVVTETVTLTDRVGCGRRCSGPTARCTSRRPTAPTTRSCGSPGPERHGGLTAVDRAPVA
jgi:hypothetical protein